MPSCRPSVGSGQPGKTLTLLASGSSPVVLSLLACLSSSVCEVRRTATATLQTLAQVDSSPFHPTIDRRVRAMGKFCEEAGTGTGKARDKTC
ncbi:HEAT repeat-containing protein 1-like isoform 3-T5 [Salvelinus alpinus]